MLTKKIKKSLIYNYSTDQLTKYQSRYQKLTPHLVWVWVFFKFCVFSWSALSLLGVCFTHWSLKQTCFFYRLYAFPLFITNTHVQTFNWSFFSSDKGLLLKSGPALYVSSGCTLGQPGVCYGSADKADKESRPERCHIIFWTHNILNLGSKYCCEISPPPPKKKYRSPGFKI